MSRTVRLTFAGLALFFVLFPLTLQKPGLPQDLKSDEPAYYLMALSLVHDFDLLCETKDIQRLTNEFPYNNANNLILMTDDDWKTVWFGKPYLISLLAAPAVALFGANGFLGTNMALLMLCGLAGRALPATLQPGRARAPLLGRLLPALERLRLRLLDPHRSALHGLGHGLPLPRLHPGLDRRCRPAAGGASCAPSGTPPAGRPGRARRSSPGPTTSRSSPSSGCRRSTSPTGRSAAAGRRSGSPAPRPPGVLVCGISIAFTGHPSAYLGVERSGVRVLDFTRMPDLPIARSEAYKEKVPEASGPRNSWSWIFRLPEVDRRLPENAGYFFVGRHTGLLLYAPFSGICLLLFALYGRRSPERWGVLAALAGVAFFFLTLIPFNWHGGGGFIGNRYFVNALPALLFLVTRIAPAWLTRRRLRARRDLRRADPLHAVRRAGAQPDAAGARTQRAVPLLSVRAHPGAADPGLPRAGRQRGLLLRPPRRPVVGRREPLGGRRQAGRALGAHRPARSPGRSSRSRPRSRRTGSRSSSAGTARRSTSSPTRRPATRRGSRSLPGLRKPRARRRRQHLLRLQDVDRSLRARPSAPRSSRRSRRPRRRRRSWPGRAPRRGRSSRRSPSWSAPR